jgi:hypothetical protein
MAIKRSDCTQRHLLIMLTRYIKSAYRKNKDTHNYFKLDVTLRNVYDEVDGKMIFNHSKISFGGNDYMFNHPQTICDLKALTYGAFEQSSLVGEVYIESKDKKDDERIINEDIVSDIFLFGKSCSEFARLNTILSKNTKTTLSQLDICSLVEEKDASGNLNMNPSKCDFLCFQPQQCMSAIEFISKNKRGGKMLTYSIKNLTRESADGNSCDISYLEIVIASPLGRKETAINIYPSSTFGSMKIY